jgi:hypothetical protein
MMIACEKKTKSGFRFPLTHVVQLACGQAGTQARQWAAIVTGKLCSLRRLELEPLITGYPTHESAPSGCCDCKAGSQHVTPCFVMQSGGQQANHAENGNYLSKIK